MQKNNSTWGKTCNYALRLLLLVLFLPFASTAAFAQFNDGKVYQFNNVGNKGMSMVATSDGYLSITNSDEASYAQLWYVKKVSTGIFTFRNLANGKYLRSSNATSGDWTLVDGSSLDDNCRFKVTTTTTGKAVRAKNSNDSYHFMHYGATTGRVVCWESGNAASNWTFKKIDISEEELNKQWERIDFLYPSETQTKAWETALSEFFTDQACTQLRDAYASATKADLEANEQFKSLPETLQNMIVKMTAEGSWAEPNVDASKPAWDAEYAKRLRVQLIEPYCDKEAAASALNMNAHTNLNNPTGFYANANQPLYIFVEGEVKDGATLYLASWTGHGKPGNSYTEGVELKPGLNVVTYTENGTTGCFNYVVKTFDVTKGKGVNARARKLSDYKDIKIHIEGGVLNGYFNTVGDELWGEGDDNADWDYYAARATHTDLTAIGKFITLQYPLYQSEVTENNPGLGHYFTGKNIAKQVVEAWDNVTLWQRMLMGIATKSEFEEANKKWQSPYSDKDVVFSYTGDKTDDAYACNYDDYYRVHALSFGVGGNTYMYGSWDHSGYNFNTMGSIMSEILTSAGSHWGPAHEIGHQHQAPFTLNGLTEVTNNLFSNVALWYFGQSTSRVNGSEGCLEKIHEAFLKPNSDFYTNNIWGLTHMYYRLFTYYHVLGHNTEFYPRLYEMIRQQPMQKAYQQDGAVGLLHFYKLACLAAGEDLTEFFRAHGLLSPMYDRFVGDYANSIYNMSQQQVDDAIAFVKKQGFKENIAVLFNNDGTGEEILSSRGNGKALDLYEGYATAEVGSYAHFYDTPAAETMKYAYSGSQISMSGKGGVGYAIRNKQGEILGFANKKKFNVNDATIVKLINGEAEVQAFNGDNTYVVCEATSTAHRNMLNALIVKARNIIKYADNTSTKVGYYYPSALEELEAAVATATEVYNDRNAEEYGNVAQKLVNEMDKLSISKEAMIQIVPNTTYILTNVRSNTKSMTVNEKKFLVGANTNTEDTKQQWIFEAASQEGTYFLKNKGTNTYVGAIEKGKQGAADANSSTRVAYKLVAVESGRMALQCTDDNAQSLNLNQGSGYILGWSHDGDDGSLWTITATTVNEAALNKRELQELVTKTNNLLNEMGEDVLLPGYLPLQSETETNPFFISSNADQNVVGDKNDGGGIAALIDNNVSTYFHTQWSGTGVGERHYIQVDLGEGKSIAEFTFTYATRNAAASSTSPAPTSILVYGSNDSNEFTYEIATFAATTEGTPLPAYTEAGAYWTSSNIVTEEGYRYLRFVVPTSTGPGNSVYQGFNFFAMSEFSIYNPNTIVNALKDKFVGAEDVYVDAANEKGNAEDVLEDQSASNDEVVATLTDLQAAYDALYKAYNNAITSIDSVNTADKATGIFDISGRRIHEIKQPGLYIINGKKHYVK